MLNHIGDGLLSFYYSHLDQDKTLLLRTPDALHINHFLHLFPEGRLVILIRDGRDTVDSFVKSWGGKGSFRKMCKRWAHRMDEIDRLTIQATDSAVEPFYKIVRYDHLVESTESTLRELLEFLQLATDAYDWDELANAPVLGSSTLRGNQKGVNWNPIQKTRDFAPHGKWKSWSSRDKRIFKRYAGQQLIQWRFEDTNDW